MKAEICSHCSGTGEEPDAKKIGKEMRAIRVAAKHSGVEVANAMDISPQYLNQLEQGQKPFDRDLITSFKSAIEKITQLKTSKAVL